MKFLFTVMVCLSLVGCSEFTASAEADEQEAYPEQIKQVWNEVEKTINQFNKDYSQSESHFEMAASILSEEDAYVLRLELHASPEPFDDQFGTMDPGEKRKQEAWFWSSIFMLGYTDTRVFDEDKWIAEINQSEIFSRLDVTFVFNQIEVNYSVPLPGNDTDVFKATLYDPIDGERLRWNLDDKRQDFSAQMKCFAIGFQARSGDLQVLPEN